MTNTVGIVERRITYTRKWDMRHKFVKWVKWTTAKDGKWHRFWEGKDPTIYEPQTLCDSIPGPGKDFNMTDCKFKNRGDPLEEQQCRLCNARFRKR